MKKSFTFSAVSLLLVLAITSCAPEAKTPETAEMLAMLPVEAEGVFFVNVKEAMSVQAMDEAIKKDETYQKYDEFIQATGIDPQKDIYYIAAALLPGDEETKMKGAGIINLTYDPDSLMALIKAKSEEEDTPIREVEYGGHTIHFMESEEETESGAFSFLDGSHIIAGSETGVKSVIDVVNHDKDNIYKNQQLSELMAKTAQDTMFWGTVIVPSEAAEAAATQNPMLQTLSSVQAVTLNFDYKDNNISIVIKMMSPDSEKNTQIAESLTGIKSFGRMAAQENPEIGELLDKINIQSDQEMVEVSAVIPEELINKLRDKADQE